ncbi:cation acetate symporter [Streptomycetaceae bacterium NBC_01309]
MISGHPLVAVVLVCVATALFGVYGLRPGRATSDFFVASRTVSPMRNAAAIGGEYLSAASFLGIAGLVLAFGADMLWYGIGYTAGYLVLLALVAAPLRRSGAYTLPDFAEVRLGSVRVRRLAAVMVVLIGWLYLLPQLQGASLTLRTVSGAPLWAGPVTVTVVVVWVVAWGGMRSVTLVQAFQYWLKLTAIALPVVFLLLAWRADGAPWPDSDTPPRFRETTTVSMRQPVEVRVAEPVVVTVRGHLDDRPYAGEQVLLTPGTHRFADGAKATFPAGADVPHPVGTAPREGRSWTLPLTGTEHPLYATYSLLVATLLGTMGLPHVLVRFHTSPDGPSARRTTRNVLGLLSVFYLMPPLYGLLGRIYTPELLMTGRTDATVLLLPGRLVGGTIGTLLGALVLAGAFAAFLSTASGLTMSVAGVFAQEIERGRADRGRGGAREAGSRPVRRELLTLRLSGVTAAAVPCLLSLVATHYSVADVVSLAFAVAASSFCPLLLLGIWWRGLTPQGAAAGLLVGGGTAMAAVVLTMAGGPDEGWAGILLSRPAAWTVPLTFAVMVGVSYLTRKHVPPGAGRALARLHAPESLGLSPR